MVADVALNGAALGFTSDQFLRYELNITASLLKAGANTLSISFPTGRDPRNVEERWMSCSGGWVRSTRSMLRHPLRPQLRP